jgi:hypothetical protein
MKAIATFLLYLSLGSASWVQDDTCRRTYEDETLHRFAPDPSVQKVIHSCSTEEMRNISGSPPQSQRWSKMNSSESKETWSLIYHRMAQRKLTLIGDSVMFQILIALLLYLENIGITCDYKYGGAYLCPNGFQISRPHFTPKFNDEFLPTIYSDVYEADISILNTGHHYGTIPCSSKNLICSDLQHFFGQISANLTSAIVGKKVVWLDSLLSHFPAPQGSYQQYRSSKPRKTKCAPLKEPLSYSNLVAYEPSQLIHRKYPYIPVIKTCDLLYDRFDMHQGLLTHRDTKRLDCVHFCLQPCFWEAILMRVGKVLVKIV